MPTQTPCYSFVLPVRTIAGKSIQETCREAVLLSRHLQCFIETEINDVKISVCGAIMSPEDVYAQFQHAQKSLPK
jgi:hypothetical protein